jgi:hypothetical protein
MKVSIFGKDRNVVWSNVNLRTPASLQAEIEKLLGKPVPMPPDAKPKKSRILMRKG